MLDEILARWALLDAYQETMTTDCYLFAFLEELK